jgi:hypothetical protein
MALLRDAGTVDASVVNASGCLREFNGGTVVRCATNAMAATAW